MAALEALFHLQWELKQDGVEAALEQSRRGGHLWIFGENPLLASQCRVYIYNLALRLGVPVKGGGLKDGIEVFPRQDQIAEGAYGNAIRAPLGVHRKSNRRYWFYEADITPEVQLDYLEGLSKLTAVELADLTQGMELPRPYRPPVPVPFVPRMSRLPGGGSFAFSISSRPPASRTAGTGRRNAHPARKQAGTSPATISVSRSPTHASISAAQGVPRKKFERRSDNRFPSESRRRGCYGVEVSAASDFAGLPFLVRIARAFAAAGHDRGAPKARDLLHAGRLRRTSTSGEAIRAARRGVGRRRR